jgi:hypothetical protein
VAWRAGGFWWLLLGTPDLPSGEGGVFCGGSLLVEKMNSVDPDVGFFFFVIRTVGFLNSELFFLIFKSNQI